MRGLEVQNGNDGDDVVRTIMMMMRGAWRMNRWIDELMDEEGQSS